MFRSAAESEADCDALSSADADESVLEYEPSFAAEKVVSLEAEESADACDALSA